MQKTTQRLHRDLARISDKIPLLTIEFSDACELWAALAGSIDDIKARVVPANREWLSMRIDALLLMNGKSSRTESGAMLEATTAMPAPLDAMRVDGQKANRSAIGRGRGFVSVGL
jgi:hypothetical protein